MFCTGSGAWVTGHTAPSRILPDPERQAPYDIIIYGIQNMTQMNKSVKKKETHRQREPTCGCQGQVGEGKT